MVTMRSGQLFLCLYCDFNNMFLEIRNASLIVVLSVLSGIEMSSNCSLKPLDDPAGYFCMLTLLCYKST